MSLSTLILFLSLGADNALTPVFFLLGFHGGGANVQFWISHHSSAVGFCGSVVDLGGDVLFGSAVFLTCLF